MSILTRCRQHYWNDKTESCERRLPRFTECIAEIESWMTANRLKMNTDKTDFIWLGSKHQLAKIQSQSIWLEAVHAPVSSVVTCLGVQFDSHRTFTPHVQGLARRCFYHLRQLRSVRQSLSYSDDVSGIENKEKRSKDSSLWYTTKDS